MNENLEMTENSEKRITVGEISEKMQRNLFSSQPKNDFEKKCLERELILKEYINVCFEICKQHIYKPELEGKKLSKWRRDAIHKCLKNLSDYIEELASSLDKDKIEKYIRYQAFPFIGLNADIDFMFLIQNSYYGSIISDILWTREITIHEAMELSGGKLDLNSLGNKLPNKIREIEKEILPFFNNHHFGKRHSDSLKEALQCYHRKYFKACNLLLMIAIEGIVRDLGEFLIVKQKLNIDLSSEQYNSLNNFLSKVPWESYYEIDSVQLSILQGVTENKRSDLRKSPFETVKINLKTRLDFLRRRFKEDRDLILHGIESEYGKSWHLYVNFSALTQVKETIEYYDKLYK